MILACSIILILGALFLVLYMYLSNKDLIKNSVSEFVEISVNTSNVLKEHSALTLYPLVVPISSKTDTVFSQLMKIEIENSGNGPALNCNIICTGPEAEPFLSWRGNGVLSQGKREKITLIPAHPSMHFPYTYYAEEKDCEFSFFPENDESIRALLFYQDALGMTHLTIYALEEQQWRYIVTIHDCKLNVAKMVSAQVATMVAK